MNKISLLRTVHFHEVVPSFVSKQELISGKLMEEITCLCALVAGLNIDKERINTRNRSEATVCTCMLYLYILNVLIQLSCLQLIEYNHGYLPSLEYYFFCVYIFHTLYSGFFFYRD